MLAVARWRERPGGDDDNLRTIGVTTLTHFEIRYKYTIRSRNARAAAFYYAHDECVAAIARVHRVSNHLPHKHINSTHTRTRILLSAEQCVALRR